MKPLAEHSGAIVLRVLFAVAIALPIELYGQRAPWISLGLLVAIPIATVASCPVDHREMDMSMLDGWFGLGVALSGGVAFLFGTLHGQWTIHSAWALCLPLSALLAAALCRWEQRELDACLRPASISSAAASTRTAPSPE